MATQTPVNTLRLRTSVERLQIEMQLDTEFSRYWNTHQSIVTLVSLCCRSLTCCWIPGTGKKQSARRFSLKVRPSVVHDKRSPHKSGICHYSLVSTERFNICAQVDSSCFPTNFRTPRFNPEKMSSISNTTGFVQGSLQRSAWNPLAHQLLQ